MANIKVNDLYNLDHTKAAKYLEKCTYPWEILPDIEKIILEIGATLSEDEYDCHQENVWIAKDAVVYPTVFIKGPAIIGHRTELRQSAFVRGNALVGDDCVVGNSTELKNVILFDNVQVPHFNYVGDSVLGYKSHMGAGCITSNVKSDKLNVVIKNGDKKIPTNRKKVGAMLGDMVEIGCNSVLNPGTVIGRRCIVYPTSSVRGCIPENHIFKSSDRIEPRKDITI